MLLLFALPALACLAQAMEGDVAPVSSINGSQYWSTTLLVDHPKCKPTFARLVVFSDPERCQSGGRASVQVTIEDDTSAPKFRSGYTPPQGLGIYKLQTKQATWHEAKVMCESEGGHLAVINSDAEALVLAKMIERERIQGDWFFVGFHDQNKEGQYVTIFGDSLTTAGYTKWNPGQPDNAGNNENCGTISRSGGLNDYPCNFKAAYFCEQEN